MLPGKEPQRVYHYEIDGSDCITFVCSNWLKFARDNGAVELNRSAVIGQSLWQFIADQNCQELYRSLFSRVRQRDITASFPFRCDSPTVKRLMEMHLSQLPQQHLRFEVRLIRTDPQPYCRLIDPEIERSDQWVTMCAWCKRIKDLHGQWIEISEAAREFAPRAPSDFPNVTHGICPPCQDRFLGAMQDAGTAV